MTNVAWTQAPEAPWSVDLNSIDLLVPPPRSFRRSLVLTAVTVVIVFGIVVVTSSGLLRPKLGLEMNASYTAAGPTSRPNLAFNVRNNGRFALSIVGVDVRTAGLSDARVTIAPLNAGGELGPAHGFPLTVQGGGVAHITMTFATWNCQAIARHGSYTVPIHLSSPLGLSTTVSVVPGFHFDPPGTGVLIGWSDPNEIGWAAGITWTSCHRGSGPPNTAIPPSS
jgi:hypothetical protein